ncbi:hypothetical protein [Novosphingobium sp. 9]|uniref:hypothetical protein n=1 Tax=Novosphingobium sp. 9 TaxID=2025349 RepID=UPI0021B50705|nr:hypothetical protein [Novosphingobium sp. 9]
MAVPHSGMLGQAPEDWLTNGERDRNNPALWYKGKTWTYPELEAERGAAFEYGLTMEERTERAAKCRAALDEMAEAYKRAKVDVCIVLGKDQKEIWPDQSPRSPSTPVRKSIMARRSARSMRPIIMSSTRPIPSSRPT